VRPPEKISQRVLTSVKRARQPLYRESAKLLEQYQRLQNRNLPPGEASDILRNVYIRPNTDNGGRLFELYWLFTLLDQYPDPELQLIQAGTNLVAEWTSDRQQYRLYHHSTGPPELDFTINSEEVAEELELLAQGSEQLGYFRRAHTVQRKTREISQQVLGREHRETLYSGVPDILLIRTDSTGELTGLLIGKSSIPVILRTSRLVLRNSSNTSILPSTTARTSFTRTGKPTQTGTITFQLKALCSSIRPLMGRQIPTTP